MRFPRFKIAHYMTLSACLAVGLAAWRWFSVLPPVADRSFVDVVDQVGRGLLEAGEPARAKACWRGFLRLPSYPVAGPVGWYHLGECLRRSGDAAGAREAFEKAAGSGIDGHFTRLAALARDQPPA